MNTMEENKMINGPALGIAFQGEEVKSTKKAPQKSIRDAVFGGPMTSNSNGLSDFFIGGKPNKQGSGLSDIMFTPNKENISSSVMKSKGSKKKPVNPLKDLVFSKSKQRPQNITSNFMGKSKPFSMNGPKRKQQGINIRAIAGFGQKSKQKSMDIKSMAGFGMSHKSKATRQRPVDIRAIAGFGPSKSKQSNVDIRSLAGFGNSSSMGNIQQMVGVGTHQKPMNIREIAGISSSNATDIIGDRVSSKQRKFLKNKDMDMFADYDGDGVINGLDCNPYNKNQHGIGDRVKNFFKGQGFTSDKEMAQYNTSLQESRMEDMNSMIARKKRELEERELTQAKLNQVQEQLVAQNKSNALNKEREIDSLRTKENILKEQTQGARDAQLKPIEQKLVKAAESGNREQIKKLEREYKQKQRELNKDLNLKDLQDVTTQKEKATQELYGMPKREKQPLTDKNLGLEKGMYAQGGQMWQDRLSQNIETAKQQEKAIKPSFVTPKTDEFMKKAGQKSGEFVKQVALGAGGLLGEAGSRIVDKTKRVLRDKYGFAKPVLDAEGNFKYVPGTTKIIPMRQWRGMNGKWYDSRDEAVEATGGVSEITLKDDIFIGKDGKEYKTKQDAERLGGGFEEKVERDLGTREVSEIREVERKGDIKKEFSFAAPFHKMTGYALSNKKDETNIKQMNLDEKYKDASAKLMSVNPALYTKLTNMAGSDRQKLQLIDRALKDKAQADAANTQQIEYLKYQTMLSKMNIEDMKNRRRSTSAPPLQWTTANYEIGEIKRKMQEQDIEPKSRASFSFLNSQQEQAQPGMYAEPPSRQTVNSFSILNGPQVQTSDFNEIEPRSSHSNLSEFALKKPLPEPARYNPEAPKFVYRRDPSSFTRKSNRVTADDELAYNQESVPSFEKNKDSEYPSTKPMRGWKRVYVGKGRVTNPGRRKLTSYQAKRHAVRSGMAIPRQKFVKFARTYQKRY
jgi:hypothetical protein